MNTKRHGLSVGIERINNHFLLTLSVKGKLEHEDYQVMVPMLESAIEGVKDPIIYALIDCTELEGWELRAMWDDLKFGLKHRSDFSKIALIGNKSWQSWATKVGGWFISGETKFFDNEHDALAWLQE